MGANNHRKLKLVFLSDGEHRWLAVKFADLRIFPDVVEKISDCSYVNPSSRVAWLEEDSDAPLFIEAAKGKGWIVEFEFVYVDVFDGLAGLDYFAFNPAHVIPRRFNEQRRC